MTSLFSIGTLEISKSSTSLRINVLQFSANSAYQIGIMSLLYMTTLGSIGTLDISKSSKTSKMKVLIFSNNLAYKTGI